MKVHKSDEWESLQQFNQVGSQSFVFFHMFVLTIGDLLNKSNILCFLFSAKKNPMSLLS